MLSGVQTLSKIESGLREIRSNLKARELELQQIKQQSDDNLKQQTELLRELAQYRLDAISAEAVIAESNRTDRHAQRLLEQRDQAQESLSKKISDQNTRITSAEAKRTELAKTHEQKVQKVIDLETDIQTQLDSDSEYRELFDQATELDSTADRAEDKAKQAQQDHRNKGRAYESDKIFNYLWKRGFDTSEYKGRGLAKVLDKWCARLCKYEQARVDYWTLLEIPKRLATHAKTVREQAEGSLEALEKYERNAANKQGLADAQEATLSAQAALDEQDQTLTKLEDERTTLDNELALFLTGQDDLSMQATHAIMHFMDGKDGNFLREMAKETYDPKDDYIGAELDELRNEFDIFQTLLSEQKALRQKENKRLKELEQVRQNFKSHHFDDIRSSFNNENLFISMLGQFLIGLVSSIDLWKILQSSQQHRRQTGMPDFGSGGLGRNSRRSRRSNWQWPTGAGGKFRVPSSGRSRSRRSKGGFRTGGGF